MSAFGTLSIFARVYSSLHPSRSIGYIYIGWIGTMIVVAIASYCLMAIILNAPHFPEQQ